MVVSNELSELLGMDGVARILWLFSAWSAKERGAGSIELVDLVRAIYIVDLEHLSSYWRNWEDFEGYVESVKRVDGRRIGYVNRMMYLVQVQFAMRDNAGEFISLARASQELSEVMLTAKRIANDRTKGNEAPKSRDFLYSLCIQDNKLATDLMRSGLDMEKLRADVTKPG